MAAALAAPLAGCGNSSDGPGAEGAGAAAAFPVTVPSATEAVVIERKPRRIVSLSPSATETLFALGAGAEVVAVDDQSDFPAHVPRTKLSSLQPNVEAIAGYRPDLVVVPPTIPQDALEGLRKLRLTVLDQPVPRTLEQAYDQFRELGTASGHPAAGKALAQRVRTRVERLIATAPRTRTPRAVFHELDPELFSASSTSFIGRVYARLGLRNVADPAAERAGSEYPQLSSEAVVSADPDLIVLADRECCDQTPAKVRRRPGWDRVAAVRTGAIVGVHDDIASRWGPRIPVFVERVVRALEAVPEQERAR